MAVEPLAVGCGVLVTPGVWMMAVEPWAGGWVLGGKKQMLTTWRSIDMKKLSRLSRVDMSQLLIARA